MATQNSINNTSNPLASSAVTVDPGASGDSYIQFDINTTGEFRMGVDDDASDAFKISQGSALGTNDTFAMSAAGERTLPLQPAFSADVGTTITNVTGNDVLYTCIYNTEAADQGSDYSTSTGLFTAPIAAKYKFVTTLSLGGITTSQNNCPVWFGVNGTAFTYVFSQESFANVYDVSGAFAITGEVVVELAAADTIGVIIQFFGGTQVVDLLAGASFSGFICV